MTIPALIAHQAAILRTFAKIDVVVKSEEDRAYTMTLEKDAVRAVFEFEFYKQRWHLNDFTVTKDGEELDVDGDLTELLKLLNEHDDGVPGMSAVTRRSPTHRDRGVEVRKNTVIRT